MDYHDFSLTIFLIALQNIEKSGKSGAFDTKLGKVRLSELFAHSKTGKC
ncbi:MAG: hypothetical protein ACXAE3_13465 [Candidatus Kariarchaeaceae archaeon]|jgi:hypothetical protein